VATYGGGAGPINTFSGQTLARGSSGWLFRVEEINFKKFSDAELLNFGAKDIHADSTDLTAGAFFSIAYGVTDNWTVSLRAPYFFFSNIREPHEEDGKIAIENEGNSLGHGDLLGLVVYRFLNWEEKKVQAALITGLEMPTGYRDARTLEGGLFELEHQPGSGSWDPVAGLAVSKTWDRFSVHSNIINIFNTRGAQDTRLGNVLNYNLAFAYTLGKQDSHSHTHQSNHHHGHDRHDHGPSDREHAYHENHHENAHGHSHGQHDHGCPHKHPWTADLLLEINGFWIDKVLIGDERDPNTGGHFLFIAPGVRLNMGKHWSMFFSGGIPIQQSPNGYAQRTDYRFVWGASVGF
jgi:hypothetical protein